MRGELLILLLITLLFSCCSQKTFDSEEELLSYIKNPENGYFQQKTINGVNISLLYRPTDLLVSQELGNKTVDKKLIDSLREKYSKYLYFNLSLSKGGQELLSTVPSNRNEFGAMVNQLVFGMGEKVYLYTNKRDTIPLADYVYPRIYGMSGSTSMLFVYPKEEISSNTESITFSLKNIGMQIGEVAFKFNNKNISNKPLLNL